MRTSIGGRAAALTRAEQPGGKPGDPLERHEPAAGSHYLVPHAGDDDGPAFLERPQPGVDHGPGVGEPAVDRRVADVGTEGVNETSTGGTRTERGHRNAGCPRLRPQGRAERQYESLARSVHRLVGRRLERDRGRDVENPAAASSEHAREERASESDHGADVDGHLVGLPVRVGRDKQAVAAKPGVVDQHFNRTVTDVIEQRAHT